jgi:hypothetical protein
VSRKRPSIIDDLDLAADVVQPARESEQPHAASAEQIRAVDKPTPSLKAAANALKTSIYLPKPVYRKLKEIALTTDRKPHDLFMEGIDMILAKYGYPSITELVAKK